MKRQNIETIIFGFLVSLTLKASLDTGYGKSMPGADTWLQVWHAVWVLPSFQVFAFLITLVRFVYGAYRMHEGIEQSPDLERWVLMWNIPGTLVLFTIFYLTGLSVLKPEPFYVCLGAVHVWDLLWFIVPAIFSDQLDKELKNVMRRFLLLDVITVVALVIMIECTDADLSASIIGAVIMTVMASLDFWLNRVFYFHPPKAQSTGG